MPTDAKINLKTYATLSVLLLILELFLANSHAERGAMLAVFCAAGLNHWMLVNTVRELVRAAATGEKVDKGNVVLMVLGKVGILLVALSFGVQIMGNRIIIPVIIYVLQIAILYLSFEKKSS